MNNLQRKRISRLIEKLKSIRDEIYEMKKGEEEKYEYLAEVLKDSEYGESLQEAAEELQEATDSIDDTIINLQCLIDN